MKDQTRAAALPMSTGLSPRSRRLWRAYTTKYEFEPHEAEVFEQALKARDLADRIAALVAAEGERVDGKPHVMLPALRDANQTALRYWRACGFKAEDEATRRPGRRAGISGAPSVGRAPRRCRCRERARHARDAPGGGGCHLSSCACLRVATIRRSAGRGGSGLRRGGRESIARRCRGPRRRLGCARRLDHGGVDRAIPRPSALGLVGARGARPRQSRASRSLARGEALALSLRAAVQWHCVELGTTVLLKAKLITCGGTGSSKRRAAAPDRAGLRAPRDHHHRRRGGGGASALTAPKKIRVKFIQASPQPRAGPTIRATSWKSRPSPPGISLRAGWPSRRTSPSAAPCRPRCVRVPPQWPRGNWSARVFRRLA